MRSLWSSPTTSPRRWRVRKPVPQATSSVRAGGSAPISSARTSTSSSQPGRSRSANRPRPSHQPSHSHARPFKFVFTALTVVTVRLPLESVPNFSEGRDRATIDALAAALSAPAELLDVHSDFDHNRSVFTLVGDEEALVAALLAGVACARERIDLREHEGAHPRIGAADVVPVVALDAADADRARECALVLAGRIGAELQLPVSLYGEWGAGRGPAFFRRGGPEGLQARIDAGELAPDFGPARVDPRAGGVVVGARRPLIAFNVNLTTDDVEVARAIAAVVRERGGGFPGVRALGLSLPRAGHAQVSMNVEDYEAAALHEIVARVEGEARERGVEVSGTELVGLMPAAAAVTAAGSMLRIDGFTPEHVLELRLLDGALGLE